MSLRNNDFGLFSAGTSGGGGGGTVTSVNAVSCTPTSLCVTGGPISGAGTFCFCYIGPTGPNAVEILGGGTCSTYRCCVNNLSAGSYSAALGGANNSAAGACSAVVGGSFNCATNAWSFIGGGFTNVVAGDCSGIVAGHHNCAIGAHSFVGAGECNQACSAHSVVAGGLCNCTTAIRSAVLGGKFNTASGCYSTTSGGYCNTSSGKYAFIGAGRQNTASGCYATNLSGRCNIASGILSSVLNGCTNCATACLGLVVSGTNNFVLSTRSTIINGSGNRVCTSSNYSTIVGGAGNCIDCCVTDSAIVSGRQNKLCCRNNTFYNQGFIGGGCGNTISAGYSSILNGCANFTCSTYSNILGGRGNCITTGNQSSILNGQLNTISGNGFNTIVGGCSNKVCSTAFYSTILGGGCNINTGIASQILGGCCNTLLNCCGSIVGGVENSITACAGFSTILSGCTNSNNSLNSVIGGGNKHCINGGFNGVFSGTCNCINGCFSNIDGGTLHLICTNTRNNVISGGDCNTISGSYSFIGGGQLNKNCANRSVIGGGDTNTIFCLADKSFIGGGFTNKICCSSENSFIGGGDTNTISCNVTKSVIVGGYLNIICFSCSTIIGGLCNCVCDINSTIISGECNRIGCNPDPTFFNLIGTGICNCIMTDGILGDFGCSTILNGRRNTICTVSGYNPESTIINGCLNTISGYRSIILGGEQNNIICESQGGANLMIGVGIRNTISGYNGAILNGYQNCICDGSYSSILNGLDNTIDSNGSGLGKNSIFNGCNNQICCSENSSISGSDNTICELSCFVNIYGSGNVVDCCNRFSNVFGFENCICIGPQSFNNINGGCLNLISDLAGLATILNGCNNKICCDNGATTPGSNILGGVSNTISSDYSSIVNGNFNCINQSGRSFIGTGCCNCVSTTGDSPNNFIGNGNCNTISGYAVRQSSILNGSRNTISGYYNAGDAGNNTIVGGFDNFITGSKSVIGGGNFNNILCSTIAPLTVKESACNSFIGGGQGNLLGGIIGNAIVGGTMNTIGCVQTYSVYCAALNAVTFVGDVTTVFPGSQCISFLNACNEVIYGCVTSSSYSGGYTTITGNWSNGSASTYNTKLDLICNGGGSGISFSGFNQLSTNNLIGNGLRNCIQSSDGGRQRNAILSGTCNLIDSGINSTIANGFCNTITGASQSFIGSGFCNTMSGYYPVYHFIGAGQENVIDTPLSASILNGCANCIISDYGQIFNGTGNCIAGSAAFGTILNGQANIICDSSGFNAILAGSANIAECGCHNVILGGSGNCTNLKDAVVEYAGIFGCDIVNDISCSFKANQLIGDYLSSSGSSAICANSAGTIELVVSDCRLKTGMCNLSSDYGLNAVMRMNPITYYWCDTKYQGCQRNIGFVAQEIKEILPEVVGKTKSGFYSFDSSQIIPTLVKSIQELKTCIDSIQGVTSCYAPVVIVPEAPRFNQLNFIQTSGIVQLISNDKIDEIEISKVLTEANNVIDNVWANKPIDYVGAKEYQEINITNNLVDWKVNDSGFTLEFNNLDIVHIENLIKEIELNIKSPGI